MTRNLLLIAIRFLVRQKVNTTIKIGGLAVGFTCCLLTLLYVHFEHSYDSFHKKSANIFRVVEDVTLSNGTTPVAASRGPVGPTMANEIGEVLRSVRLTSASMLMKFGENHFQEDNVYFADSTIFDIFSFPILKGDPETALTKPQSIVLTRKAALRYFGNSDPIGREMMIDNQVPFTVTGIVEDIPGNSHLQFDILLSMSTRGEQFLNSWTWSAFTYIEIDDPENIDVVQQKLSQFGTNHKTEMLSGGEIDRTLSLQPLNDIHLYSKRSGEAGTPGNASNLLLFSVVAGLVLLIACVNFINLTTAQASNRAREVGIRKVIGGTRIHLVNQFMIESILLSIAASLVAFGTAHLLLPAFVQLTGSPLSIDVLYTIPALAVYFLISIVVVVLQAGIPRWCFQVSDRRTHSRAPSKCRRRVCFAKD